MVRKIIIISSILVFLILGYIVSKFAYFSFQEDVYYSVDSTSYVGIVDYIKEVPKEREIHKKTYKGMFLDTTLLRFNLKIPFDNDSVDLKIKDVNTIVGDVINKDKGFVFFIDNRKIKYQVNKEAKNILKSLDTSSLYTAYDWIYSYQPQMNILTDSYATIKYNLRMSHLKSVIMPSGGDQLILKLGNQYFKGFQFGEPKKNKVIMLTLFFENEEVFITFNNFTQEEIDFILSSLKRFRGVNY